MSEDIKIRGWMKKEFSLPLAGYDTFTIRELMSGNHDFDKYEGWGRYTGLKDKNGKEIYEGDILRAGKNQLPTEMKWAEYGAAWITSPIKTHPGDWSEYEVIGNIFENKDLLQ